MANTITLDATLGIFNIVPDGSTDFDMATEYPQYADGVIIESIGFLPSAANDKLRVGCNTATGVDIMTPLLSITGGSMEKHFADEKRYKIYIDESECTFSTPGSVIIVIKFRA